MCMCMHVHVYAHTCIRVFLCTENTTGLSFKIAHRKKKVPSILSDTYFKEQEIKTAQKHYIKV